MSQKIDRLDLNLLRVFDRLMEEQHLSRAAARLHLSQPATSNALARLRDQLGDPLFVRTARGMQPTPRAIALHGRVRQALRLLADGLAAEGEFDPAASTQTFTVAMNDYAEAWLLPRLVARLAREAPSIVVSVEADLAESLPSRLASGALDLAIDYLYFDEPELIYQPLTEESLVVIGRVGHPAFDGGLTLDAFQSARHVSVLPRAGRGSPLEIVLGSAKVKREVGLYLRHYLPIPAIVAQTDLLGTVPRRLAERFASTFPIAIAELPMPLPPTQVSLIWHRQQADSPGLGWLRSVIVELMRSP